MHAFRQFVQSEMDARGWRQADLARRSGLSPQHVSVLLNDDREALTQKPDEDTIVRLAEALGGGELIERRLWAAVARAMGLPVGSEIYVPDVRGATNDELLREVSRRLAILDEVVGRAAYDPNFPKSDDQK